MSEKTAGPIRRRTPRVMKTVSSLHAEETERQLDGHHPDSQCYVLRLYITGTTPASMRAVEQVRKICEEHLKGRYELQVIDIYQMPALAKDHQIVATPTLIKVLPTPLRRFIGDLSKAEKVLFGMELREKR